MSESANCVEQREEQTELEEAGGAEVRWFKTGIVSFQRRVHLPHSYHTSINTVKPLVLNLWGSQIRLCETFTLSTLTQLT